MTDMPTHSPLTLYNSLTREKQTFTPQDPKRVTMYNCGPTVYSYAHIGNARAAVVADVLFRVLRHIYGEECVVYARNITDVDDKIIKAAAEQGVPISEITEKFARIYNEDLTAIGCLAPTHQPKATEHISHMIKMISGLIEKGFAYESDGHVFFDISTYDDYGKLSGNTLDALRGGDRVGEGEVARKKNAADFVLWKPEAGGVGWDAPFGKGRPGWHIECSAMAKASLDEVIDIHCGGVDLKFPHHENEIAQSCCGNGTKEFAKFWVHNEFLNMARKDGTSDKMSKSLGNVTLIHDLLKEWDGEVIRLALLKAHYRSELNWSEDLLKESKKNLDDWYRALKYCGEYFSPEPTYDPMVANELADDLSVKWVIMRISAKLWSPPQDTISYYEGNQLKKGHPIDEITDAIVVEAHSDISKAIYSANLLGLLQKDPEEWFKGGASADDEAIFDAIAKRRETARAEKNWAEADAARDEAKALGIILEDGPDGTTWRKA